ncbi:MAG: glycosyltransferase family 9 protein, partial [Endomicrobiales bacterium]
MRTINRILCVSTTGMGNVLLYLPVIRTLRTRYPHAVIDVLVSNAPAQKLLEQVPEVNSIIPFYKRSMSLLGTKSLLCSLKCKDYDLYVTSYLDKSFKVALLGRMLNIPVRVGFEKGFWGMLLTHRVRQASQKHEVQYNLDLMRAIGITEIKTDTKLVLPSDLVKKAYERMPKVP